MVMNVAHGSPEQLFFDLRHRRWPLRYSLPADADKKACDEARKELTSSLKPILREYLTKDRSAVSVRPFVEAPSTISPAHYFSPDEELVPPDTERGWNGLRCFRKSILYVRMHPKLFVAELSERKAATLLWENRVGPFRAGSGYSDARNQYGGIVYSADRDAGEILSATQLFRSREVWAVDTSLLTWITTDRPTGEEVPCIPSQSYEEIIADGLRGNLSFARDVLDYSLPVVVEAGASDIAGFYMGMGSKYLNSLWGPVHREHIQKRCELTSWDEDAVNDVLLAIFEEFFDAVGAPRPEQLNGFPPSSETGKVKA